MSASQRVVVACVFVVTFAVSAVVDAFAATNTQKCEAAKLRHAGSYYKCRSQASAKFVLKGDGAKRASALAKCDAKMARGFAKAEGKWGAACPGSHVVAVQSRVRSSTKNVASLLSGAGPSPPGCLSVTGATTCSSGAGAVIPCAGTGQDGETQAGDPFAFVDNGNGTITDHNTGLTWEKKSNDGGMNDVDARYHWEEAFSVHVATLNASNFAGFSDWRLPNVRELLSIGHYGTFVPPGLFGVDCIPECAVLSCSCTATTLYWSSTTFTAIPSRAFAVGYRGGVEFPPKGIPPVTAAQFAVRAVRGGL